MTKTKISSSIAKYTTEKDGALLAHGVDVTGATSIRASSVVGLFGPALRILREGMPTTYVYHGRTIRKYSKDGCSPRWNGFFVRLADAIKDADIHTTRATVRSTGLVGRPVTAETAWLFAQATGNDTPPAKSAIDYWAANGDLPSTYTRLHRLLIELHEDPRTKSHRYVPIGARGRAAAAAKRDRGRKKT